MKLAIVGTAPSAAQVNQLGEDYVIWTLNGTWRTVKRTDQHFELHDIDYLNGLPDLDKEYFKFLAGLGNKAVLKQSDSRFPDAQTFPLGDVLTAYPERFLTSTPALILAYALATYGKGIEEILIFGIDMAAADEYRDQRECFYYYLGIAKGMGIALGFPNDCPLLKADYIYSYESPSPVIQQALALNKNALQEQRIAESQKLEALKREQFFKGVEEATNDLIKAFKR